MRSDLRFSSNDNLLVEKPTRLFICMIANLSSMIYEFLVNVNYYH